MASDLRAEVLSRLNGFLFSAKLGKQVRRLNFEANNNVH